MKRWAATAAIVLGLLGAYTAPAQADPINTPNALTFPITCDGTTYTVVGVPGQGQWTPALVTTSNVVLVPFSFDITFTDLTTGESFHLTVSKEAVNQANATCTFAVTFTDPETGDMLRIAGTVAGLHVPPVG
jgi:hypothetical protein